jgi:hypothetical protein
MPRPVLVRFPESPFPGKLIKLSHQQRSVHPDTRLQKCDIAWFSERIIAAMALIEQGQSPYVFYVRAPGYVRALGVFLLVIGVATCSFIVWRIGLAWIPSELGSSSFLIATVVGLVSFALWLIFPPQNTLARFEFTDDSIRFVPNWVARWVGEQSEETVISAQSSEILISHYFVPERVNGYRIIVRAPNGTEDEVASRSPHTQVHLSASEIDRLVAVIAPATGIPVRVVIRRTSPSGIAQETPWTPPSTRGTPLKVAALATFSFPYTGGILMGWYSQNPAIVIGVGFALWSCMVLAIYLASRSGPAPRKFPWLQGVSTLVTFWAAYALCFVVTAHLRGHI